MAFECDECHRLSVGQNYGFAHTEEEAEALFEGTAAISWLPNFIQGRVFEDVPEPIAAVADEAHRCQSIQAFRGAMILARAAVESTVKDQEAEGVNLFQKIDALRERGIITAHTTAAAHAIRDYGNDAAHHNVAAPVLPEESAEILELMSQVLQEVYQQPARIRAVQAARAAKRAAEKPQ